jgi:hypothetical protein
VTKDLYFDEAGYTGANWLDPEQPVFAVASTDIDSKLAEELLRASFPNYQGPEFKFTNIWRSNNKMRLVEFGRLLGQLDRHEFVYYIDKRFGVLTKIVDFLIEPIITNAGYDFYSDGFCWKYSNYIWVGLTNFEPELLEALLKAYHQFSREPTPEQLRRLQIQLRIMSASCDERVQIFLDQMALGAEEFQRFYDLAAFRGSSEIQVTSLFASMLYWRRKFQEDFAVVTDESSNFLRNKDMWDRATNSDVPAQTHVAGDGEPVEFPIRVVSTTLVDSKTSHAVQLCDVLAGFAARHFDDKTSDADRELLDAAIESGLGVVDYNGIRPALVFPDAIPPRRLDGPDVVDRLQEVLFGQHNEERF